MQTESLYLIIPCSLPKKMGESEATHPGLKPSLLELRLDGVGVVGFLRLAKVALAAELCRRGRVVAAIDLKVGVVGAVHEEVRGIELAAAIARDRAARARRVNRHDVLVVAGSARHIRQTCAVHAVRR